MIVLSFVLFLKGFSDVENKGAMSYNIIIIGSIVVLCIVAWLGGVHMKNYQTALDRYRAAADEGDTAARRKLGRILLEDGLRYLEDGVLQGNAEALDILSAVLKEANRLLYKGMKQSQSVNVIDETDFSKVQPGNVIYFGRNADKNEAMPWRVLDVQEGKVLLLSEDILEYKAFHDKWGIVTWENASIRKYLNTDFMDKTFSDKEKFIISTTRVVAHENPMCNTDPGRDTKDKVFLLSAVEVEKYFPVNMDRKCSYCMTGKKNNSRPSWWWLRSPGFNEANAASVGEDGGFAYSYVRDVRGGIRPALWVEA